MSYETEILSLILVLFVSFSIYRWKYGYINATCFYFVRNKISSNLAKSLKYSMHARKYFQKIKLSKTKCYYSHKWIFRNGKKYEMRKEGYWYWYCVDYFLCFYLFISLNISWIHFVRISSVVQTIPIYMYDEMRWANMGKD